MADTSPSTASPKIPLKLIAGAVLVVVLGGGGFYGWTQYQHHQPKWSLQQIPTAMENKDLKTFQKHVDTQAVIEQAIDDMADEKLAEVSGRKGALGGLMEGFGKGMLAMMKPQLVAGGVSMLEDAIEKGSAPGLSETKMQERAAELRTQIEGATQVSREGKSVVMAIPPAPESGITQPVEVKMRQLEDGTWQVTAISNMDALLPEIPVLPRGQ